MTVIVHDSEVLTSASGDALVANPDPNRSVTVLVGSGGKIVSTAGSGILVKSLFANISIGTSTNRVSSPVTGGNGSASAQGIAISGIGPGVSVFGGDVPIASTSTGGDSWGIKVSNLAESNGSSLVDTAGPVSGPGGILVASGTEGIPVDSVIVTTAGPVTGSIGSGIQTSSANGSTIITVSAPVRGATGVGIGGGITATGSPVGIAITTLANGTVTATGPGANGISAISAVGAVTLTLGADVTSTDASAIKLINTRTPKANTISIGTATIRGLGTASAPLIDMTTVSGALTTVSTAAGTSVLSNSPTPELQNADLAIRGAGGNIIINNAGLLRGRMDFSGITAAGNSVTVNNSSTQSWHSTGPTTFSAGDDTFNNTGLVGTSGITTLDFGSGTDVFNNSAGSVFSAAAPGATTTRLTNLETFNNAGTLTLADGEANDRIIAPNTAYVGSGSATIAVDAVLGQSSQVGCSDTGSLIADCVSFGSANGNTIILVNDAAPSVPAGLNLKGITILHTDNAAASNFVLGGTNVVGTPQGRTIQKGLVQYGLAFDAGDLKLVATPNSSMMEMAHVVSGLQNIWYETAEAGNHIGVTRQSSSEPDSKWTIWLKPYYAEFSRDRFTSLQIAGSSLNFDTSYNQMISGILGGVERVSSDAMGAWKFGATLGYSGSTLDFEADNDSAHYSVWNLGAYTDYVNGPLFAALAVNDDEAQVQIRLPSIPGLGDIRGRALGAKATIGERFSDLFGRGIDLQPEFSLAAVRASLDSLAAPGANFDFASGTSIRATLGTTISTDVVLSNGIVRPFLFAGIGNEFDGVNTVAVASGDTLLKLEDRPFRVFGIASAGISFFTNGPFAAFVRFDGMRAKEASSGAIRLGVHLCLSACSAAPR